MLPPAAIIDSSPALDAAIERLRPAERIAVDTESNSLHAYRGTTCLIQLSTPAEDLLIDPLVIADISALGAIPLIGWIGGLVEVLAVLAGVVAVMTGFGAVIITRGGKYTALWPDRFDEEMDMAVDWSPVDEPEDDEGDPSGEER